MPDIPAPKVVTWDDGSSAGSTPAYVAEEFIYGQPLNVVWPQLSENQKVTIIREIANVLADLGETRFHVIDGLALDALAGPTIEAAKALNGRVCILQAHLSRFLKMAFLVSLPHCGD